MKKFTVSYNKKNIMNSAHKFFKSGRMGDWSECLKKAWHNAKVIKEALESLNEEAHTWFGWTQIGKEVLHGQKTAIQVVINSIRYASKTTEVLSFFTKSQVCDLGTQPDKA